MRFFGDSIAIAYGSESRIRKGADGKEARRCQVWTDTWLKRNGQWRIVAAQVHYPVSLMNRCFFCGCCYWALSLAFLVPVYSMEAAHRLGTHQNESPPVGDVYVSVE